MVCDKEVGLVWGGYTACPEPLPASASVPPGLCMPGWFGEVGRYVVCAGMSDPGGK